MHDDYRAGSPQVIQTTRGELAAILHTADAGAGTGVLMCHAFGEERKSSALTMARLAGAIAAAGLPVLRFDYFGTGDSEGDFVDADDRTRMDDIVDAAAFLRSQTRCTQLVLLGLRMGGTLAANAARRIDSATGLVLIEPLPNIEKYLGGELRRQLVRQMMTHGKGSSSRDETMSRLEQDDYVLDLDGFAIRAATYRRLCALGIRAGEVTPCGPVLVVQMHFNEKPKAELEGVCEAYREAGADVDFVKLVAQPIWQRIDVTLIPQLDASVTDWLVHSF